MIEIGTQEMYSRYIKGISEKICYLVEENKSLNKTRNYNISRLETYKDYISNFTNIDLDKIVKLVNAVPQGKIKFSKFEGLNPNIPEVIKNKISTIIHINRDIYNNEKQLEDLKRKAIPYDEYVFILNSFNKKISEEILNGYTYNLGNKLSQIRIRKVPVTKKRVHWGDSNKLKAAILKRGGVPLKGDNGGEPWILYVDKQFDYIWYWKKHSCSVPNRSYYRFKPTIYDNTEKGGGLGNINKLKRLEREQPERLEKFYN